MNAGRYSVYFAVVLFAAVIINTVSAVLSFGSSDFFPYDIPLPEYSYEDLKTRTCQSLSDEEKDVLYNSLNNDNIEVFNRKKIAETDTLLAGKKHSEYETEYFTALKEYLKYNRYIVADETVNSTRGVNQLNRYKLEEANKILDEYIYRNITRELAYKYRSDNAIRMIYYGRASGYERYISGLVENARKMSETPIFSERDKANITGTSVDMYRLQNISVSAVSDDGVKILFSGFSSDMIAVVAAVLCAVIYAFRCRSRISGHIIIKSRYTGYTAFLAAGIFVLYFMNSVVMLSFFPGEKLSYSVQSYQIFRLCPFNVTLGRFAAGTAAVRTAAVLTVYFAVTAMITSLKKRVIIPCTTVFFILQIWLWQKKYTVNIINSFRISDFAGTYSKMNIAGKSFQQSVVLSVFTAFVFFAFAFTAAGCIRSNIQDSSDKAEEEYFDEVTRKYNESRHIRHDIRNHLSVIGVLIDSGDIEGAKKYIDEITEEIDKAKAPVHTGSGVLDALLYRKYSKAVSRNIKTEIEFLSDLTGCGIRDYDICSIFSNILDNAIEASVRLIDNRRHIALTVKDQMNMICIFCENNYADLKYSGGNIVTIKDDKVAHGIGLKRISHLASKYGGTVDINTDNNVFTISVLLVKK